MKSVSRILVTLGLGLMLGSSVVVETAHGANDWYLIHGTAASGARGVYPASPGQPGQPGARRHAATWTDSQGRLWMFGGMGYAETSNGPSSLSDIWMYDPNQATWYWMGGHKIPTVAPTYPAIIGQPGTIGARHSSTVWRDSQDNLWLFGGYGMTEHGSEAHLSDMWKLNTQTMTWTFEGDSKAPNDAGDYRGHNMTGRPAARREAAGGVTLSGEFLFFGGAGPGGSRNDLWRYTPATRTWTWLNGPGSTGAAGLFPPYHGQEGTPGARYGMAWYMETVPFHTLWIFGGYGQAASSLGILNDLWRYEVNSNKFYWVAGSNAALQNTVYPEEHGQTGTLGSRNGPMFWHADGKFWISGGYGITSTGYDRFNDLWSFQRIEAVWRFIDGPKGQTEGIYPAPGGKGLPLGRMSGQTWTSGNRMYLFGGSPDGANVLSDFWFHHATPNSSIDDWQLLED